ncbi:MAG: M4 family metallopeptidase [Bacteroidales bacterium]|nr:M4 family metallopeptidase [Bacteroidales bacterium]
MMRRMLFIFVLFFGVFVHANEKGRLNLDLKEQISLDRALDYVKSRYDLDGSFSFKEIRNYTDELGIQHVSYQQYYNDFLIENGMIMFHAKKNNVYYINGSIMTQDEKPNVNVNSTRAEITESPVLLKYAGEYVMCYKRNDYANHKIVFISRENGDTIKTLSTAYDVVGKGLTIYNGMQDIEVMSYKGAYSLITEDKKVYTIYAGNVSTNYNEVTDYRDASFGYISTTPTFSGRITEITISNVAGNWWGNSLIDANPDLYIVIKDSQGNELYTGDIYNDQMSATWDFRNVPFHLEEGSTIEIYDDDLDSNDFGGSVKITTTEPGIYTWNSEYSSGSIKIEANPAVDAHWGMQKVLCFYKEKLNRNGYNNLGTNVYQFIDPYAQTGTHTLNNAYANYDQNGIGYMCYGLGDGILCKPFVALDVMAHEFTHLVTNFNGNSGLIYENESGALNESFADIIAISIDFYAKGDKANWVVGEDIMIMHDQIRSLSNPKLGMSFNKNKLAKHLGYESFENIPDDVLSQYKEFMFSSGFQPDTYKGEYWIPSVDEPNDENDKGGVHTNSGVQNYWFYLLSEGGSGINDNGDTYDVTGIGIESAYKIAYRNLTTYLLPNATFKDAMHGSLKAAIDLFGKDSKEYESVLMAWHAVGVKDDGDSVDQTPSDKLKFNAYSDNGQLIVNALEGSLINVYDVTGQVICRLISDGSITYVNPRGASIVVVKVDDQSQKIIIK